MPSPALICSLELRLPIQPRFLSGLTPWEQRTTPETSVKGIQAALNRQLSQLPEGRAFAILPPAIPGFGRAGGFSMMLQDRSGGSIEFLAEQVGPLR